MHVFLGKISKITKGVFKNISSTDREGSLGGTQSVIMKLLLLNLNTEH